MIAGSKIAIDARMIEMSGIGTYIQHIINSGIYDVALGKAEVIHKYNPSITVIDYPYNIYGLKEQLKCPNKKLQEYNVKLVHFPHYNVPVSYKGKYIVTIHDLTHIVLPELLGSKIKQIYAKQLMAHTIKHARHILTVSEYSKEDIKKRFNVSDEFITVTYNAIDNDYYIKNHDQVSYLYKKYGIPENKKIILYVGNLKPHKNLKRLLNAYSISKCKEDSVVILVGKAFNSENIKSIESEYSIKNKVFCTGMVSKEEIVDFYNIADVFAFSSLYEGFGIPPLEAMACGTPVICSNSSSLPEVVGDAAVLFDPYNVNEIAKCLNQVLTDTELSEVLIKKGLKQVKKFSWEKTVEITKNEIIKVIADL